MQGYVVISTQVVLHYRDRWFSTIENVPENPEVTTTAKYTNIFRAFFALTLQSVDVWATYIPFPLMH